MSTKEKKEEATSPGDDYEDDDDALMMNSGDAGAEALSAGLLRGPPTPAGESKKSSKTKEEEEKPAAVAEPVAEPAVIEENIEEVTEEIVAHEERRWDGEEKFTKQEFLDFYGGTEEWDEAAPVEDEPVLSKNLASTMGTLPNGWNMVAGMRIGGDPLRWPMSDFAAAVEEAQKMGRSCGGLNEEGGSFTLMKAGQVLVSDANCTAYTSSA